MQSLWLTERVGIQQAKLNVPENISLLPLPPYSPELNPMEQVWQQLRQRWLANRCYANYEAIVDATCVVV